MNGRRGGVVSVMDIGGTHVTAANVDTDTRSVVPGQCLRAPLDSGGSAEEIVSALAWCARRLAAPARRWSIAIPGPFDYERGIGRFEGVGKFDALRGVDLRAALGPLLPGAASVGFQNDADAFAFGEWWAGAVRGHRTVVAITLGTGVGSCFLRDGRSVRHGGTVPPDGRVDLLRHEGKPLEDTVSRRALRRAYAQATGEPPTLDVREIAQHARHGDRTASIVLTQAFRALGTVLGPWLTAFEPTILVVGGSIAASWDLIAEPLRTALADTLPTRTGPIALQHAQHLTEAPLLGAAYLDLATATQVHPSPGPREAPIP